MSSESIDVYFVEKILKKRTVDDQVEYLIKWQGWPMDQCSWEPAENLNSCPELVEKFEKIQTEAEKKKRIRSLKNELNKSRGAFKKFIPEEIMNATNVTGELLFLMKWQNESSPSVVKASEANTKCPLVVIDFYEKRLHIVDSYE